MNSILIGVIVVVIVSYLFVTVSLFLFHLDMWHRFGGDQDDAKAAFRAPLWPFAVLGVVRDMWTDSRTEKK